MTRERRKPVSKQRYVYNILYIRSSRRRLGVALELDIRKVRCIGWRQDKSHRNVCVCAIEHESSVKVFGNKHVCIYVFFLFLFTQERYMYAGCSV